MEGGERKVEVDSKVVPNLATTKVDYKLSSLRYVRHICFPRNALSQQKEMVIYHNKETKRLCSGKSQLSNYSNPHGLRYRLGLCHIMSRLLYVMAWRHTTIVGSPKGDQGIIPTSHQVTLVSRVKPPAAAMKIKACGKFHESRPVYTWYRGTSLKRTPLGPLLE